MSPVIQYQSCHMGCVSPIWYCPGMGLWSTSHMACMIPDKYREGSAVSGAFFDENEHFSTFFMRFLEND